MAPEHHRPGVGRLAGGVAAALRGGATREIAVALAPPASVAVRPRGVTRQCPLPMYPDPPLAVTVSGRVEAGGCAIEYTTGNPLAT